MSSLPSNLEYNDTGDVNLRIDVYRQRTGQTPLQFCHRQLRLPRASRTTWLSRASGTPRHAQSTRRPLAQTRSVRTRLRCTPSVRSLSTGLPHIIFEGSLEGRVEMAGRKSQPARRWSPRLEVSRGPRRFTAVLDIAEILVNALLTNRSLGSPPIVPGQSLAPPRDHRAWFSPCAWAIMGNHDDRSFLR